MIYKHLNCYNHKRPKYITRTLPWLCIFTVFKAVWLQKVLKIFRWEFPGCPVRGYRHPGRLLITNYLLFFGVKLYGSA